MHLLRRSAKSYVIPIGMMCISGGKRDHTHRQEREVWDVKWGREVEGEHVGLGCEGRDKGLNGGRCAHVKLFPLFINCVFKKKRNRN